MSDQAEHPADDHQAAGAEEQRQLQRSHIFVVNSSPPFLDLMRDLLQEECYNVTTTTFVPQTFEQIEALEPHLIMVDVMVGQEAGWELLQQLQTDVVTRNIPVIVTSTNPHLLERAEGDQDRYAGRSWMAKPFDLDHLLTTVEDLVGTA